MNTDARVDINCVTELAMPLLVPKLATVAATDTVPTSIELDTTANELLPETNTEKTDVCRPSPAPPVVVGRIGRVVVSDILVVGASVDVINSVDEAAADVATSDVDGAIEVDVTDVVC